VQGQLWQQAEPWLASVQASRPYWWLRSLSAIPVTAGFVLLGVGLLTGQRDAARATLHASHPATTPATAALNPKAAGTAGSVEHKNSLSMAYLVTGVAGIGFFVLSMLLLGVWPGKTLDAQIAATAPPAMLQLTPAEQRGRQIYAREGCAYCHTQQIRYLEADIRRFGAPTLAWETRFDSPHLWGTRRIGPDLSRTSGTRSSDWHYAHLFAPRSVVPLSIMPSYAALFDGTPLRPLQEARDLLAYLESLGRARQLAWPEGDAHALTAAGDDHMAHMAFTAPALNMHPAQAGTTAAPPDLTAVVPAGNGQQLWLDNCASCHGSDGSGNGPAAAWLTPKPANLIEHTYTRRYLTAVLWNGVAGTAMPAWREQTPATLAALVAVVGGFSADSDTAATDAASLAQGQLVYETHCIQCHGSEGGGDGFAAAEFSMAAVDFRVQRPSQAQAMAALVSGVAGTPMAPWTARLDSADMLAVTAYLRSFYVADAAAAENANAD